MKNKNIQDIIYKLINQNNLSEEETFEVFNSIMSGNINDIQVSGFLTALSAKGETVSEITGGVKLLKNKMLSINSPSNAIDTVGTGGDGLGTYNISTACAFVVSSLGIPIAKHGNRSVTSKSGASDVLKELGVNIEAEIHIIEKSLNEINITFLNAPKHHPTMKNVATVRKDLGVRTIFNLLGPLVNPANVNRQLIGVYNHNLLDKFAQVLNNLGTKHSWVVHGSDGLDEITTTGKTFVAEVFENKIRKFEINPENYGITLTKIQNLVGGTPKENATAIIDLFNGKKNSYRDIVTINSAAAILISGKSKSIEEGIALANKSLDNGLAMNSLKKLINFTNNK
ncbi:anthranilate phosphoribosyltransferase [Alphaproteobacteria bacterium]|nr:anthranilate phosphoribosyltransferase [Alphaproteobacteria bacterium]